VDAPKAVIAEITATATQSARLTANRIRLSTRKQHPQREQIEEFTWLTCAVNDGEVSEPATSPHEITVYWRPGCGFCGSLFRQLEARGIVHHRINIWHDDEGAATVRSVARGHETVPTVIVGDIGLVNPSVHEIVAAVEAQALN
jgi:mycoredoxin